MWTRVATGIFAVLFLFVRVAGSGGGTVTLRVMTYNVHSCKGKDGRIRPDRIAKIISHYRPDVVALQEIRVGHSKDDPFTNQPTAIANATGMTSLFYPLKKIKRGDFGIAILSRHPIRLVRAANLPTLPGREALEKRGAIWAVVTVNGTDIQVLSTHLGLNSEERSAQIDALLGPEWIANEKFKKPFVMCGDFNSRPSQSPYKRLVTIADDAVHDVLGRKSPNTWHSSFPVFRIDHVFVPKPGRAVAAEVPKTDLTRASSDHLPVVVDLVFGT